ncbi:MAG: endonuclease/exonuclease/phosphatase family protein [Ardenticatenaceae bacterium]|nr:endonuclease/exonuclease/phosphatase family protein [Ardenticatenaceae bacterium]
MKKNYLVILALAIIILFFIQLAGTLVESIYILDLMNSRLDAKVLGVLFFFTPILLTPFYKKTPRQLTWITFIVLLLTRGILPYLKTANQVLISGIGTFAVLSLFLLLLSAKPKGETPSQIGLSGSAGLALAVGLSVLLRTLNYGIEYSLTPAGGWVGWGLGLCLGWLLLQLDLESKPAATEKKSGSATAAILGLFLILTLVWFAFSAPAVIARWTEGNYTLIVLTISLLALAWVLLSLNRPQLLAHINANILLFWNLIFTLSLTATILVHRVPFPPTPDSAPVVVTSPGWFAHIPLILMLLLFPVIFLDMRLFLDRVQQAEPTPRNLIPGILLGSLMVILLVFMHIFTNVWGYVKPISPPFRNAFWLPYFLLSGLITLLAWRIKENEAEPDVVGTFHWGWVLLLGVIFLGTLVRALPTERIQVSAEDRSSLVVMTFNTQQSNDDFGEKSYDRQLELIRRASPDILSLQETDSTRISLNNNDYVRYYAEKLGYYSYFGPTPVTGTYGTAILSKYPLLNTRTVFTYSDKDETGIAEAEIEVAGRRFTIYDVHPDGSDTAMLVFAKVLLERSKDKPYVVALGDYNLRDYEEAYKLIDAVYTNVWTSIYPSKISADGVDMSGENRIDHIFLSPTLHARNPIYVLVPESATDHAVHWTEIYWDNP